MRQHQAEDKNQDEEAEQEKGVGRQETNGGSGGSIFDARLAD